MKLVIDEKLKHRLVGLAVIISLGTIFVPAIMKQSTQGIEKNPSVHLTFPTKPLIPKVVLKDEKEMYKTIQVAKVNLPPLSTSPSTESLLPDVVKAEPIQSNALLPHSTQKKVALLETSEAFEVKAESRIEPITLALHSRPNHSKTVEATKEPIKMTKAVKVSKVQQNTPTPAISKNGYTVQLGSFVQLSNAKALVNRLHAKGYKANYIKVSSNKYDHVYKVYVGNSPDRLEAMKLKTQLVSAVQLDGVVVNRVS